MSIELILSIIAAASGTLAGVNTTLQMCLQGYCRSSCCCVSVERENLDHDSEKRLSHLKAPPAEGDAAV